VQLVEELASAGFCGARGPDSEVFFEYFYNYLDGEGAPADPYERREIL
jgi:hypothetical protein